MIAMKLVSIPKSFGRPQFKVGRRQIIPTAKALHRQMAEAMAAGDKETLRKICTPLLYNQLMSTLAKRKATERVSWELVKYNKPLTYPRIASYKAIMIPQAPNFLLVQTVVAIDSTQKLAKYNKSTDKLVAGSAKVRRQVEYVVLTKWVDRRTWKEEPWRMWGSVEEITFDEMIQQNKDIAALNREKIKGRLSK
jgi:mitochondrial protein MBA1